MLKQPDKELADFVKLQRQRYNDKALVAFKECQIAILNKLKEYDPTHPGVEQMFQEIKMVPGILNACAELEKLDPEKARQFAEAIMQEIRKDKENKKHEN